MMNQANSNYELEMEQRKKLKIGKIVALGVVLFYALIAALILNQNAVLLPILTGTVVFLFGPITAFFYLIDVKRGVFKSSPGEDAQ